jgi:hypothetical protein
VRTKTVVRETERGPSTIGPTGKPVPGPVISENERITEEERYIPADPAAARHWLQVRQGWSIQQPVLTVEDVVRLARAARAEAKRRGITFGDALEKVQTPEYARTAIIEADANSRNITAHSDGDGDDGSDRGTEH